MLRRDFLLRRLRTRHHVNPRRLLIAAAIFHLTLTLATFAVGRYEVLPLAFDANGNAISFAPDSALFTDAAVELSNMLDRAAFIDWVSAHQPLHVRLYSLSFAILGPLIGRNV